LATHFSRFPQIAATQELDTTAVAKKRKNPNEIKETTNACSNRIIRTADIESFVVSLNSFGPF
jgi:hypothetical protein